MKMLIIFFLVKIYQISAVQFCSDVKEPRALCRPCGDSGTKHHKCPKQCGNGRELQLCDSVCSDRCHNSECRYGDDGSLVCLQGCTKFFMGPYCQQLCMDGCVRCTQDGKRCLECEMGRYGETCQQTCDNCKDDMCRMNGTCITGCKPGYYGKQCQVGCDKCKLCDKSKSECDVCDQTKGTCFLGCSYGYYGPKCDRQCDPRCTQCHDETGKCQQCEVGWFGKDCTQKCQNCKNMRCDFDGGSCLDGCAEGFQKNGTTCQRAVTEKDMAIGVVSTPVEMGDYSDTRAPAQPLVKEGSDRDFLLPAIVCLLVFCAGAAVVGLCRFARSKLNSSRVEQKDGVQNPDLLSLPKGLAASAPMYDEIMEGKWGRQNQSLLNLARPQRPIPAERPYFLSLTRTAFPSMQYVTPVDEVPPGKIGFGTSNMNAFSFEPEAASEMNDDQKSSKATYLPLRNSCHNWGDAHVGNKTDLVFENDTETAVCRTNSPATVPDPFLTRPVTGGYQIPVEYLDTTHSGRSTPRNLDTCTYVEVTHGEGMEQETPVQIRDGRPDVSGALSGSLLGNDLVRPVPRIKGPVSKLAHN